MLFSARALIHEMLYEFSVESMWLAAFSAHSLLVFFSPPDETDYVYVVYLLFRYTGNASLAQRELTETRSRDARTVSSLRTEPW